MKIKFMKVSLFFLTAISTPNGLLTSRTLTKFLTYLDPAVQYSQRKDYEFLHPLRKRRGRFELQIF